MRLLNIHIRAKHRVVWRTAFKIESIKKLLGTVKSWPVLGRSHVHTTYWRNYYRALLVQNRAILRPQEWNSWSLEANIMYLEGNLTFFSEIPFGAVK